MMPQRKLPTQRTEDGEDAQISQYSFTCRLGPYHLTVLRGYGTLHIISQLVVATGQFAQFGAFQRAKLTEVVHGAIRFIQPALFCVLNKPRVIRSIVLDRAFIGFFAVPPFFPASPSCFQGVPPGFGVSQRRQKLPELAAFEH